MIENNLDVLVKRLFSLHYQKTNKVNMYVLR